jgi:outer membrane protein assembly factor BamB
VAILAAVVSAVLVAAIVLYRTGSMQSANQIIDDPESLDDIHLEIPELDTTRWVQHYLPERCFNGVNLLLFRRRVPMLLDMNGRLLHYWPKLRATGRVRLDEQGRVTIIGRDDRLKEYDWHGKLTWSFKPSPAGDFPHHDFIRLANGSYLVPVRSMRLGTDYLVEVDRQSQVVWQWQSYDYLETDFPYHDRSTNDPVHINSVHELPANRWYEAGDQRFRPGNILVSARHLDCIFIIDRRSGEVVWTFREGLDRQHEARMVDGGPYDDMIVVFNNRTNDRVAYRSTKVQIIDPLTGEIIWDYGADSFFSSVAGSQVVLPNGNLLISSSHGGRVFEIDLDGKLVWQYVPILLPMRAERYSFDHCPQLAELSYKAPQPVISQEPFIDKELTTFAIVDEREAMLLHGAQRQLVQDGNGCRTVWLPARANMRVNYGINPRWLFGRRLSARFRATLQPEGSGQALLLVDDRVSSDSEQLWRRSTTKLSDLAWQRAELCLSIDEIDGPLVTAWRERQALRWGNPHVYIGKPWKNKPSKVSKQVEEHQRKQLEALGYIE